jgi:adenylate kinase family enzyme
MMMKGIILIGPPTACKSKIGELLHEDYNYFHFSTGRYFRQLKNDYYILNQLLSKRAYVNDNLVMNLFNYFIDKKFSNNNFMSSYQKIVLDGIPRNLSQLVELQKNINIEKVINLQISDEEVFRRSNIRNLKKNRGDTNWDAICLGIENYKKYTLPILDFVDSSVIYKINGMGSKKEVYKRVLDVLGLV